MILIVNEVIFKYYTSVIIITDDCSAESEIAHTRNKTELADTP